MEILSAVSIHVDCIATYFSAGCVPASEAINIEVRKLASRVAIACQGGGSHTAFTAGVLQSLMGNLPGDVDVVGLSGTSGGAICAALAWDGLVRGDPKLAIRKLLEFWESMAARGHRQLSN